MTPEHLVKAIQKAKNIAEYTAWIDKYLEYHPQRVLEIFALIPKDWNKLLYNWQLRALYEKIVMGTCKARGASYIEMAQTLFGEIEWEETKLEMGSVLCAFQNLETLINTLVEGDSHELLLLVLHELISRGRDFRDYPQLNALQEINAASAYQKLELFPMPQEAENTFRSYHDTGTSWGVAFGFPDEAAYQINLKRTTHEVAVQSNPALEAVLSRWCQQSGGMAHVLPDESEMEFTPESILLAIPEFSTCKGLRTSPLSSTAAYSRIFDAVSKGAAYYGGEYGGKGRLTSWDTVSHLIGLPDYSSNKSLSEAMDTFNWHEFNTDTWFINEWCDFGICCLQPATGTFGWLAGTDTD